MEVNLTTIFLIAWTNTADKLDKGIKPGTRVGKINELKTTLEKNHLLWPRPSWVIIWKSNPMINRRPGEKKPQKPPAVWYTLWCRHQQNQTDDWCDEIWAVLASRRLINVSVSSFICLAESLLGYNLTCLPSCQTYVDTAPSETDDWGMSQHQEWPGSLHKQGSLREEGLDKQTPLLAAK